VSFIRPLMVVAVLFGSLSLWSGRAPAQELPRVIRMVVAFPAGGPTDFVARLLAEKLKVLTRTELHRRQSSRRQRCDRRRARGARRADGSTLFLTTVGAVAVTPHLMTSRPMIRSVILPRLAGGSQHTILVVKPDMPVASAKELAELARRKPAPSRSRRPLRQHAASRARAVCASAGVKSLHVPIAGRRAGADRSARRPGAGHVRRRAVLLSQIEGGKIRALAPRPTPATARCRRADAGRARLSDTSADNWYGLLAPARTPAPVVAKLHDAVVAALGSPDLYDRLVRSAPFRRPRRARNSPS